MDPSLFPDLPLLLREKVAGEDQIDIMKGKVVRLGHILEFFRNKELFFRNKGRGVGTIGP